jgi:RNA 2',3'-cyclic 3'-phosphodiesterase
VRLFVALDFPDAVRERLRELIARLKAGSSGAKWVRSEGMHVTLKFIGETDPANLNPIRAALATIHSAQPVEMNFRGLGFFPHERQPRVLWCGVEASPNLPPLAANIADALVPLGFLYQERKFTPHLTLARFPDPNAVQGIVRAANELKSYEFGSAQGTEFHLIESKLKPTGGEYTRLASFPFIKEKEAA